MHDLLAKIRRGFANLTTGPMIAGGEYARQLDLIDTDLKLAEGRYHR